MPISERSPEARNLVILSFAILVFYIGDASLASNEIRFQVVNLKFENVLALTVLIWIMLLWFALRYWQINKHKLQTELSNEIGRQEKSKVVIWYAKKRLQLPYIEEKGFSIRGLTYGGKHSRIQYSLIQGGKKDQQGKLVNFKTQGQLQLPITGLAGFVVRSILFLKMSILEPAIGTYLVPYLLFFAALASGTYNTFWPKLVEHFGAT